MSNHAYVRTKKEMTATEITRLLHKLNKELFKHVLTITTGDGAWYPSCVVGGRDLVGRMCWLDGPRKFELRHCGSDGNFAWWVDYAITNEIALRFDGRWSDDGSEGSQKGTPNKYLSFAAFCVRMHTNRLRDLLTLIEFMRLEKLLTPPSFRADVLDAERQLLALLENKLRLEQVPTPSPRFVPMNASKENCTKAIKLFNDYVGRDNLAGHDAFIGEFLRVAYKKLPSENAFGKDKKRKKAAASA